MIDLWYNGIINKYIIYIYVYISTVYVHPFSPDIII